MSGDGGWQPPGAGWAPTLHQVARPGVIPLRPLGVGDLIGAVFVTLGRCAKAVYLPVLAATGATAGLLGAACGAAAVALRGSLGDLDGLPAGRLADADLAAPVVIGCLLVLLGLAVLHTVGCATATTVVRHAVVGREPAARQIWREARPFLGRILTVQLLGGLVFALAPLLPAGLLGLGGAWAVAGPALVLPGVALAGYAQVRLVLLVPVLVLENAPLATAIRRAWGLNKGAWWRSLGVPYVVGLAGATAAQVLLLPFLAAAVAEPVAEHAVTGRVSLLGVVVLAVTVVLGLLLALAVAAPVAPVAHGLLYVDRRIRQEDFGALLGAEAGLSRWGAQTVRVP